MNRIITGSFTRPANGDVYAPGDVINDSTSAGTVLLFFRALAIKGNNALLVSAMLIDSARQSTPSLSSELWLFTTAPTADNDNAAFTPTDTELESLIAIIPFATAFVGDGTSGAGGNVVYPATDVAKVFRSGSASQDLFGVLVARSAYVPVSGEKFTVRLGLQE